MATPLEDMLSHDPHRVWASSWGIIFLRNEQELKELTTHLPEIKAATKDLDLGGALYPNNELLAFAIRKLEFVKEGRGCLCLLYPEFIRYDPEKEAKEGNVELLEAEHNAQEWKDTYTCRCTRCGARYHVESGEYHYTWWEWKPITPSA